MTNEASNSIGHIILYWPTIESMVLTSSSLMSFIRPNRTLPAESVDGRRYSTPLILCMSLWLSWWLIWSSWPFNPVRMTSVRILSRWGGFPHCSKLQLVWCSDQRQSFLRFFFMRGLLVMKTRTPIYRGF